MKFRLWTGVCVLYALVFAISSIQAGEPLKKGIGLWEGKGVGTGLKNLEVTWFYNWSVTPPATVHSRGEFVPMVWGEKSVNANDLEKAKKNGRVLLGFNEPDHKEQANMTVEQALALWPKLQATGMRLGSPASASGAEKADSWFGQFMKGVKEKGYRVDFICVHNYQTNFTDPKAAAEKLKQFLQKVHERYPQPVWLTEFALADWKTPATPEQQQTYMKEVLPMLEKLPFVERYAWFALPPNPKGDNGALANSNLCDDQGLLNACGLIYRNMKSTTATVKQGD